MKTCNAPNCNRPVFSHGFCKYDQYRRKQFGGDLYEKKPNKAKTEGLEPRSPRKGKIPRRTKERASDEQYYSVHAKMFFDESVENKTNICFFCNKEVKTFQGLHHLKGRKGKYLLDKLWWVVVHNLCHVDCYHQSDTEHRMAQPWWSGFMSRLRVKSEELYLKELKKFDKAGLLFEEEDE